VSRFLKILLISVGALLIVLLIAARIIAPWAIKNRGIAFVVENCKTCKMTIEDIDLSLISFQVTLIRAHLIQGNRKNTEVDAFAERIVAKISPLRLLSREVHFKEIRAFSPRVIVSEGGFRGPRSAPDKNKQQSPWTVVIDGMKAHDGKFQYVRLYKPKAAVVSVKKIEARVGKWGTTAELWQKVSVGRATGVLENSGRFRLDVATPMPAESQHADISLELARQDIGEMNAYFRISDSIKLAGDLVQVHSNIVIRGTKLKSSVQAKYFGLKMEFEKTINRSPAATFFSNLIRSIQMDTSSMQETKLSQTRVAEIKRMPEETIMQFILRGLMDAAMMVSTS